MRSDLSLPWDHSPPSQGLGVQTQRRADPDLLLLPKHTPTHRFSKEHTPADDAWTKKFIKQILHRCHQLPQGEIHFCVCVFHLCAGFIHKGSDLPRERVERLHGIRWRGAPPPVVPLGLSALRQAVIIAAAASRASSHPGFTHETQIPSYRHSGLVQVGENYLLPGVLGWCSTVRWASAPCAGWPGTNTTPPSFPACTICGRQTDWSYDKRTPNHNKQKAGRVVVFFFLMRR